MPDGTAMADLADALTTGVAREFEAADVETFERYDGPVVSERKRGYGGVSRSSASAASNAPGSTPTYVSRR